MSSCAEVEPTPGLPPEAARLAPLVSEVARSDERIVALYLFGSRARGDAGPDSDVDLAVLYDRPVRLRERLMLENRLERTLGESVDLIDFGTAGAFLALDVVRGERLYCSDPRRADEFDLFVLRRAGDLAPFERERRRMLLSGERR